MSAAAKISYLKNREAHLEKAANRREKQDKVKHAAYMRNYRKEIKMS